MQSNKKNGITNLILTALMIALVTVTTMSVRIPVVATNGYIHLGDCMIFLSVLLLGWKYGALAAAIGSAFADLFAGYVHYIPVTFVVKGIMAMCVGFFIEKALKKEFSKIKLYIMEVIGMIIGGFVMVFGYYIAESFMYGSFLTPLASIPMNILQFIAGVIIATITVSYLYKTPFGKKFTYVIK